ADRISLKIIDVNGKEVRELSPKNEPGFHKVLWNLTRFAAGVVPAGVYRVVLNVDGQEFSQTVRVEADPAVPTAVVGPEMPGEEDKEPDRPGSDREFRR